MELPKPSKQHQLMFPQDKRYVYSFPSSNGKLTNETRVKEMVKSDSTIYKQMRRNTVVTTW